MTGAEHYIEAERLATVANEHLTEDPSDMRIAEIAMGISAAHATLALAAATEKATAFAHGIDGPGYGR